LQYNRERWYDAAVGRWLSQDPTGFSADDPNLYRYVSNSPTFSDDPTGLWRVVQGMGKVNVTLNSAGKGLRVEIGAVFHPDKTALQASVPAGCKVDVSFIQIARVRINAGTIGQGQPSTLTLNKWFIDGYTPPYYPTEHTTIDPYDVHPPFPEMNDKPGPDWLKWKINDVSFEYETAVVVTNNVGTLKKGDVLANFEWGFSYRVKYAYVRTTATMYATARKYYVNDYIWDDDDFKGRNPDAIKGFNDFVSFRHPSNDMISLVLSKYFP